MRTVVMRIRIKKDVDALISHLALALAGFGLLLLIVKIASVIILRLGGHGPFGSGFLDSSADSHRFIAYVGLILAGGLIYGLGALGRILSVAVGAIIIWQIVSWYSNYQSFMPINNFWQVVDVGAFSLIFVITSVYILVCLLYQFNPLIHAVKFPRPAR
jgi:hypothetical protein